MTNANAERWNAARAGVIDRWHRIIDRIEARDEAGVMALANVMDEFCDEALATRGQQVGSRCLFCEGFSESGGCHGVLIDLNRAVLGGRWDAARTLAEAYISRLESIDFDAATRIH
jgi:hypothetical protein